MTEQGKLIVVEGIDGSGKSTLIQSLMARLPTETGKSFLAVREPGGDLVAEQIRLFIMGELRVAPLAEMLLFQSARAQLMSSTVLPALDAGQNVILDRYVQSTMAYQHAGRGLSYHHVVEANKIATQYRHADLVLLLTLPVLVAHRRLAERGGELNKYDKYGPEFYDRVAASYQTQYEQNYFATRWVRIAAAEPPELVYDHCRDWVHQLLDGTIDQMIQVCRDRAVYV